MMFRPSVRVKLALSFLLMIATFNILQAPFSRSRPSDECELLKPLPFVPMNSSLDFINIENRLSFGYSGMWWMNHEEFLKINVTDIDVLEAATFIPFLHVFGLDRVLMTRDWLDFSVEHLSRYFKMIDNSNASSFQRKIEILENYLSRINLKVRGSDSSAVASTIALIPMYIDL